MKFKTIYIKNFKKIIDQTFTFKKGLNVVTGNNETGKTTLIEALMLLIDGFPKGFKSQYLGEKNTRSIIIEGILEESEISFVRRTVKDAYKTEIKQGTKILKKANTALFLGDGLENVRQSALWSIQHVDLDKLKRFQQTHQWQNLMVEAMLPDDVRHPDLVLAELKERLKSLFTNHVHSKSEIAQIDTLLARLYAKKREALEQIDKNKYMIERYDTLIVTLSNIMIEKKRLDKLKDYVINIAPIFKRIAVHDDIKKIIENQNLNEKAYDNTVELYKQSLDQSHHLSNQISILKEKYLCEVDKKNKIKLEHRLLALCKDQSHENVKRIVTELKQMYMQQQTIKSIDNQSVKHLLKDDIRMFNYQQKVHQLHLYQQLSKHLYDEKKYFKQAEYLKQIRYVALFLSFCMSAFFYVSAMSYAYKTTSIITFIALLLWVIFDFFNNKSKSINKVQRLDDQMNACYLHLQKYLSLDDDDNKIIPLSEHTLEYYMGQLDQLKVYHFCMKKSEEALSKINKLATLASEDTIRHLIENTCEHDIDDFYMNYIAYLNINSHIETIKEDINTLNTTYKKLKIKLERLRHTLHLIYGTDDVNDILSHQKYARKMCDDYTLKSEQLSLDYPKVKNHTKQNDVLSLDEIESKLSALREDTMMHREEMAKIEVHLGTQPKGQVEDLDREIAHCEKMRQVLVSRYDYCVFMSLVVNKVKGMLNAMQQPTFIKIANNYIKQFTGAYVQKITLSEEGALCIEQKTSDCLFSISDLSMGVINQVHLALRIALLDYYDPHFCMPLLIDDAFLSYDEQRLDYTLRSILEISLKRQVIMTSCKASNIEKVKHFVADVNIIDLRS